MELYDLKIQLLIKIAVFKHESMNNTEFWIFNLELIIQTLHSVKIKT